MTKLGQELQTFWQALPAIWPSGKGWVQKIYSTATHLVWALRFPQHNRYFYIARSALAPLLGFGSILPPPPQRCQDRFLDYVRAFTRGCFVSEMRGEQGKSKLGMILWHGPQLKILLFIWRGAELYFMGGEMITPTSSSSSSSSESSPYLNGISLSAAIFCSWQRKKTVLALPTLNLTDGENEKVNQQRLVDSLWTHMNQLAGEVMGSSASSDTSEAMLLSTLSFSSSSSSTVLPDIAQVLFAARDKSPQRSTGVPLFTGEQKTAIKFLQKKIKHIEEDLSDLKKWRYFFDLLQRPNFLPPETDRWTENGVTFKFQGRAGFQKVDYIYQKIKRWKAAEKLQLERLATCYAELKNVQQRKVDPCLGKIREPMWADRWVNRNAAKSRAGVGPTKRKASSSSSPASLRPDCRRLLGSQGQVLWLGKSAAANDWLRHQRSKEDWWVHLENYPSAHAFFPASIVPDTAWLSLVASLLRDTAHLTITEIPIIYTKVKNLRAIKGQAGGVTFKKEKHLRLIYQSWMEQLKEE
ncbi:MAG: hypothetical protein J6Y94_06745 [Bacteriovoracaceae bacterium]|nr:hypothetical protein [Bacteriovoracaceae bacterium]